MSLFVQLVLLMAVIATGCLGQSERKESRFMSLLENIGRELDHRFNHSEKEIFELKEILNTQNNELLVPSYVYRCPFENGMPHVYRTFDGEVWIVIQQRLGGSVDFFRNWTEYRDGFGHPYGEFWLGLQKIYSMTSSKDHELLIRLESFDGETKFARYGKFAIGGENEDFALKTLESYSGTAGDSLSYLRGQKFSTFDRDNDEYEGVNCAVADQGAWWYQSCSWSNLNGLHKNESHHNVMFWGGFYGNSYKGLKESTMMIKEVNIKHNTRTEKK